MKIGFTQDSKVANIENRVRPDVLWPQAIVMEDLAEEEGTRGTETLGDVLCKHGYLMHVRTRADLFSCPVPVDFILRGEKMSRLHLAQLEISRLRLTLVD